MEPDFSKPITEEKDKANRSMKLGKIKNDTIFPLRDYDACEGHVIST